MMNVREWRRFPSQSTGIKRLLVVTIDTEEEGRWGGGYPRTGNTCSNIAYLSALDSLFDEYGVRPTYLVDYPVAQDARAVEILSTRCLREEGEIGAHLHPWCNPPYGAGDEAGITYAGLLSEDEQRAKLTELTACLHRSFGRQPTSYRAGRWGLTPSTLGALDELGYRVDSSVTPLRWESDPHGPSFLSAPAWPYRLGQQRIDRPGEGRLLEIPASLAMVGPIGRILEPLLRRLPPLPGLGRVLESLGRTWLRPSTGTPQRLAQAVNSMINRGWPVLNIMFHSSELMPGASPYVRNEHDLARFLERLRAMLSAASVEGTRPVTLTEARDHLMGIPPS